MKNAGIYTVEGKKVTVLGAGRSGIAAAELLSRKGAEVYLSDNEYSEEKLNNCRSLIKDNVLFELGSHSDTIFNFSDMFIVSPGIPLDIEILNKARGKQIPILGELEITSRFCPNPLIAVTGTNGKSTTTMMIENIFKSAGRSGEAAGNIGYAFGNVIDKFDKDTVIVLEVSSYQLETIECFHPGISLILNITPDHLYRHKTMEEYIRCKARIFENHTNGDVVILNHSDPVLQGLKVPSNSDVWWFSGVNPVETGVGVKDNSLVFFSKGKMEKILEISELPVPGTHNVENASASAAAAVFAGLEIQKIKKGLQSFNGLEHRLEFVEKINDVTFINDSKSTNFDSLTVALNSYKEKVILIAGGKEKGTDYTVLKKLIGDSVKHLVLIGESKDLMAKAWNNIKKTSKFATLEEAVHGALCGATPGDVILFSPGCQSFDMFKDFEDRGRKFKEIVQTIKKK